MTLGERIQELRRKQGMTQEALAEALGVSRQAVSKWESDITVPEVDKLIALSRLFAVPVGVLLGVEEQPDGREEDPGAREELTERELLAVETIVRRYLEESRAHAPRRPARRTVLLCAAAGAAVLALLGWQLLARLERSFNAQLNGLYSRVDTIDRTVSNLNDIPWRIQNAMEQQNNPLSGWSCEAVSISADRQITYALTATPKEFAAGTTALFYADAGEGPVPAEAEWDGMRFTARVELPLTNSAEFSLVLSQGDSQTLVELPRQDLPWADMFRLFPAETNLSGSLRLTRGHTLALDLEASVTAVSGIRSLNPELLRPEEASVRVEFGGRVLEEIPLDVSLWDGDSGQGSWTVPLRGEYAVAEGAVLRLVLRTRDNSGAELSEEIFSDSVSLGDTRSFTAAGGTGAVTPAPPAGP